jgi:hypothetical protein
MVRGAGPDAGIAAKSAFAPIGLMQYNRMYDVTWAFEVAGLLWDFR